MEFIVKATLDDKAMEFITTYLQRAFNTDKIEFDDNAIRVEFDESITGEQFHKLMRNLVFVSRSVDKDVLFENRSDRSYKENPQQRLEEIGDVTKISDGLYMLQGMFWKVFNGFHDHVKKLAEKHNAIEQEYPILWPVDLFKKIEYFSDYPQQVILNTTVKESNKAREKFAKKYKSTGDFTSIEIDDNMENATYGLSAAVCDCCYYAIRNQTVTENRVYTTYNKVFRNESSRINSLDRLTNFSVRDIMFVGDKDFVLLMRQKLLDDLAEMLKLFDIDCKIETANDPFFTNDSIYKNVYQFKHRTKYELLAKLPFNGSDLAIGSVNLHLDFFGKSFNIKDSNGDHIYSGCIGIGFERLAYAFYCQYGPDHDKWPSDIRKELGV